MARRKQNKSELIRQALADLGPEARNRDVIVLLRAKRVTGPLFFSPCSACGCAMFAEAKTSALAPFAISAFSSPDGPYRDSTLLPLELS